MRKIYTFILAIQCYSGASFAQPGIVLNTDSLNAIAANCNDSLTLPLTIYNSGADTLEYHVPYLYNSTGKGFKYLYAPNCDDSNVNLIDMESNTIVDGPFNIGYFAWRCEMSPDGHYVYFSNRYDNTVTVLRTSDNSIAAIIPVGDDPSGIAFTPDSRYAYVTNRWSNNVLKINCATFSVTNTISNLIFEPKDIVITQDGKYAYVGSGGNNTVVKIDLTTDIVISAIPNIYAAHSLVITKDGKYVYVSEAEWNSYVSVIDVSADTVIARISGFQNPQVMDITPDNKYLYIADYQRIFVVDIATNTILTSITDPTFNYVWGMSISPSGKYAYAGSGWNSTNVNVIDIATNTVETLIYNGNEPRGLATFNGASWVATMSQTDGYILPGDSVTIDVAFIAPNALPDLNTWEIQIFSNDPATPYIIIPTSLFMVGIPEMQVIDSCHAFDTIQQFGTSSEAIRIANTGCGNLVVNNVTSTSPDFVPVTTYLVVSPGDTGNVMVAFSPQTIGSFTGDLTIFTNDGDTVVCMTGESTPPATISFSPDTFNINFTTCDEIINQQVTVYNIGVSDLYFSSINLISFDSTSSVTMTTWGQITYHSFTGLQSYADTLFLTVTINGDYNSASEYAELWIEGTYWATMDGGFLYTDLIYYYNITGSMIEGWLADGQLLVEIRNSASVNNGYPPDLNRVRLQMAGGLGIVSMSYVTDTIVAGDSVVFDVSFSAQGLLTGSYEDMIFFNSNDAQNPKDTLWAFVTMAGYPVMALPDSCLTFDTIMMGDVTYQLLTISNSGCDTLFITNIVASNPDFTLDTTNFMLVPDASGDVMVTFTPGSVADYNETLTIYSNDKDSVICLIGVATEPPVFSFSPASVDGVINVCDDSVTVPLTIFNQGVADLVWNMDDMTLTGGVGKKILMIGNDATFYNILLTNGFDVTVVNTDAEYLGNNPGPEIFSAVILVDLDANSNMPVSGQLALLNYVNNGGGFIGTEWLAYEVTLGRYSSMLPLIPLSRTSAASNTETYNVVVTHPVTSGLSGSFVVPAMSHNIGTANSGTAVITGTSALEAVVVKQYGNGKIVHFSSAATSGGYNPFTDSNMELIFLNSINWVATTGLISANNITGTVMPGDSAIVNFTYYGEGKNTGVYTTDIVITTNDPLAFSTSIPGMLTINGYPIVNTSVSCVNFDTIMQFASSSESFYMYNEGCDTLVVNDIISTSPDFSVDSSQLTIVPGDSILITAYFNPLTVNSFIDTFHISTNDVGLDICITGTSTNPPQISIVPHTLNAIIASCDDSLTLPVTVYNGGSADLQFSIENNGFSQTSSAPNDFLIINHNKNKTPFGGYIYSTITEAVFVGYSATQMQDYKVVYFEPDWSNYSMLTSNKAALDAYVQSGGIAVINIAGNIGDCNNLDVYGTDYSRALTHEAETFTLPSHDYITGIPFGGSTLIPSNFNSWGSTDHGTLSAYPAGSQVVLTNTNGASWIMYPRGNGYIIVTTLTYGWVGPASPLNNLVNYAYYLSQNQSSMLVDLSSTGDTLIPGDSLVIDVTFYSAGLSTGNYSSLLTFETNDPLTPFDTVYCNLEVIGYPIITLSETCILADSIVQFSVVDRQLYIGNAGCDTLFISDINSSLLDFSSDDTSMVILSGDSTLVTISFNPQSWGQFNGSLTLVTNGGDTALCLNGYAYSPPAITYVPDSIDVTITICNDSVMVPVTIYNTGDTMLIFSAQAEMASGVGNGQFSIFDDFDDGIDMTQWIAVNNGNASTTCSSASGLAISFLGGGVREAITKDINVSNGGTIEFKLLISKGFGGCENADAGEDVYLQYSINGGASWVQIAWYDSEAFPSFTSVNVPIPLAAQTASTRFRFYQIQHSGNNYDNWALDDVSIISFMDYISISTTADSVFPGDSSIIDVTLNAIDLISGVYGAYIIINSNDPLSLVDTIYASMTVVGYPIISVSDSCLTFDSILNYTATSQVFTMYNNGCDTLFVSDIAAVSADISVDIPDFFLAPEESIDLTATFSPLTVGDYYDTLLVSSNAPDFKICLFGYSIAPPVLTHSPASFNLIYNTCDEVDSVEVTVYNTGGTNLIYSVNPPVIPTDTIVPGDSSIFSVGVGTYGKITGNYTDFIVINSNDPLNVSDSIPLNYTINGYPLMALSDSCIFFDSIMQWANSTILYNITNTGCDTLLVTDIVSSNPDITVDTNSAVLLPGEALNVQVTFSPLTTGDYNETLTIQNNDADTVICLVGYAISPPEISFTPDTFSITLTECVDSLTFPVTIYNTGDNDLIFEIDSTGYYALFDGTDDNISVGSTGRPTNTFTMEAWVKTNVTHQIDGESTSGFGGTAGQRYMFGAMYMNTNGGAGVSVGTNGISVYEHGAGYMPALAVYSGAIGSGWNHIAVVYTNKKPLIYLNGVLVKVGLTSPKSLVYAPLAIGGGDYGYLSGNMEEVRIWNTARTATEINSNMNEKLVGNESGLVGYWNFNDSTANDISPFANHGTLLNGASLVPGKVIEEYLATYDPSVGTVIPDDSMTVEVTINMSTFNSGVYSDVITIYSNDPLASVSTIPVTINYIGKPQLTLSDSCLIFDTILQWTSNSKIFTIGNSGCDTLTVTNIVASNLDFVVDTIGFSIMPGSTIPVTVTFNPTLSGNYSAFLTISNNDGDTTICLTAVALSPPVIVTNPDTFMVALSQCDDSVTIPFTIYNTGALDLTIETMSDYTATFDGSGDYILIPNSTDFDVANFTIEAWVKSPNFNMNGFIFEKGPVNTQYSLFFNGSNQVYFRTYNSGAAIDDLILSTPGIGFTNNVWHHIAATYDGSYKRVFVDGVEVGSKAYNQTLRTGQLGEIIGAYGGTGANSYYFNGQIDEVRVWNYARSLAQISSNMNRAFQIPQSGLIGNWNFNSQNANDVSGYNHNGTFTGNATTISSSLAINDWMSYPIIQDTIVPGDSVVLDIQFTSTGLVTGIYSSNIVVVSNDPLQLFDTIPCILDFQGYPVISVSDSCIRMDTVIQWSSTSSAFTIRNYGCDTLFITDIDTSFYEFDVDATTLSILPGDSINITITFNPSTFGDFNESIIIYNNDVDTTICLLVHVLQPPVLSVSPDTFAISVTSCVDSVTFPLIISNIGGSDLNYTIDTNGYIAYFDGNNDYITVSNNYPGLSKVTTEAWIYPTNITGLHYIVSNARDCCTPVGGFNMYIYDGKLQGSIWRAYDNTIIGAASAAILQINKWQHVAMVYTGTRIDLYLNGTLVGSSANYGLSNIVTGSQNLILGVLAYSAPTYYDYTGYMDEVRIWNVARTQPIIQSAMHSELAGDEPGLISYWNFDGQNAADLTANGNNGVFFGNATTVFGMVDPNLYYLPSLTGTVAPGASDTINVFINMSNLITGIYTDTIFVASNDPLNPPAAVPFIINYAGQPHIGLSDSCFISDTILQWESYTNSFTISNTGCDTLLISDIVSSSLDFVPDVTQLTLLPGESFPINVSFNPVLPGDYSEVLTIFNNAGDTNVCLIGTALSPPILYYVPDTLNVIMDQCNDTLIVPLTIYNTGVLDLYYETQDNYAATFDGSGDFIKMPNSTAFDVTYLTMEAWVYAANYGINQFIFEKGPVNSQYSLFFEGANICFRTYPTVGGFDSYYVVSASIGITNGAWHHIAATYDGAFKRIYVDGVEKASTPYTKTLRTGQLGQIIGAYGGTGGNSYFFNGKIDEMRVWNYARSSQQIQDNMNKSFINVPTGLIGYWNFNDQTANDLSPTANHGILYGNASLTQSNLVLDDWMSYQQIIDTITSGDSTILNVAFLTQGLYSGVYNSLIILHSNDPLRLIDTIPCILTFTGTPEIHTSDSCIDFDTILQWTSISEPFTIYNYGCDTLFVSNIDTSNADFVVDVTSFSILPGDSVQINVSFNPVTFGTFSEFLTISNNHVDTIICLTGVALEPPVIVYVPDTIDITIASCVDSLTFNLDIFSIGGGDLIFNVDTNSYGFPTHIYSIQMLGDTLVSGDSIQIVVNIDMASYGIGYYTDTIVMNSNDPLHPQIIIPITLNYNGAPEIALLDTCFISDTIWQWTAFTDSVFIKNTGCDTLVITNITSSDPNFNILNPGFYILPNDSQAVNITFFPTLPGAYSATLNIYNEDVDTTMCLIGFATEPPIISVTPDTFNVTFNLCNDSVTLPLTIYNSGVDDLIYSIENSGYSAKFDGVGDYISINNLGNIPTYTIEFWRKSDGSGTGFPRMLSGWNSSNGDDWFVFEHLSDEQNIVSLWASADNNGQQIGTAPVPQGQWNHLAMTFDGTQAVFYIDNVPVANATYPAGTNTFLNRIQIGGDTLLGRYFNGMIDEVRIWNIAKSKNELAAAMGISLSGNETGLVGYWNFDDQTANDLSPSGNNGTLIGDTYLSNVNLWTPGWSYLSDSIVNSGYSARFDGAGDYISINDLGNLSTYTIEFWRKSEGSGTGGWPRMLTGWNSVSSDDWFVFEHLSNAQNTVSLWASADNNGQQIGTATVPQGQWNHLAMTFDGTQAVFYIDNVPVANATYPAGTNTLLDRIQIGGDTIIGRYFNGMIDEVRIWNIAKSSNDLASDMIKSMAGNETGLVGYWNFDDQTANDRSPSGNNGTLRGDAYLTNVNYWSPQMFNSAIFSDTVEYGDSSVIEITFNSTGLNSGIYTNQMVINSNDPLNPVSLVSIIMNVQGYPLVSAADTCLIFDTILLWTSTTNSTWIYNNGCDTLFVSNISSGNPDFAPDQTYFEIMPGDSAIATVTFSPTIVGAYSSTLTFFNDDVDTSICLMGVSLSPPQISTNIDTLNAFTASCEDSVVVPLTIYNDASAAFPLIFTATSDTWISLPSVADTIQPGDSVILDVVFDATSFITGVYSSDIIFISNDPLRPVDTVTCILNIQGIPFISFSDTCLIFDTILQWTSTYDSLWMYNNGCDTLFITDITASDNDFAIGVTVFQILPGDSANVFITFNPTLIGTYSASLNISNSDIDTTVCLMAVSLSPPQISTDSDSLTGATLVCEDTVLVPLIIYNDPSAGFPLTFDIVSNAGWLGVSSTADTVQPGDSVIVWVVYSASGFITGIYSSMLIINSNDPLFPVDTVICQLDVQGVPFISLSDTCLIFDTIMQWTSTSRSLWVNNNGCDTLFVTNMLQTDADFILSSNTMVIAPGDSSSVVVEFYPTTVGNYNASLTIFNNDVDTTICLNGISLYPPVITTDINPVIAVTSSCESAVIVPLTVYNDPLADYDLTFTITSGAGWLGLSSSIDTVQAGDSVTINLIFDASSFITGINTTEIVIASNDPLVPFDTITCILDVQGIPIISFSDTCLIFDTIMQWTNTSKSLWVNNTGCDTLFVASLLPSDPDFTPDVAVIEILPGSSEEVVVDFSPTLVGTYSATLNIFNNAVDTSVCLMGVSLSPPQISTNVDTMIATTTACEANITIPLTVYNGASAALPLTLSISSGSGWLSTTIVTDTIQPGDSSLIDVSFNASGFITSIVSSELVITSNDPLIPVDTIICILDVQGVSVISLSDTCLLFDTILQWTNTYETLWVYNDGCDTLFVSGILSTDSEFAPDTASLVILPGDSVNVLVSFSPVTVGNYYATLQLFNNDVDTSVCLIGVSLSPPIISTDIDSVVAVIKSCTDTLIAPLTIYNDIIAGFPLNYSIVTDSSWLDVSISSGTVAVGDSIVLDIIFDAVSLEPGVYTSNVVINSDDPLNPIWTIPVSVTINNYPVAPLASDTSVCFGGSNPELVAFGDSVSWYSNSSLTQFVSLGDTLLPIDSTVGIHTYYLTQTIGGCQGYSETVDFEIIAIPTAPIANDESICSSAAIPDLTATGVNMVWFQNSSLDSIVGYGDSLSTGQSGVGIYNYYVTQSVNGCESPADTATLDILTSPSAPSATDESVCYLDTVPDLIAFGNEIRWYSDSMLSVMEFSGDTLVSGLSAPGTYNYWITEMDTVNGCQSLPLMVSLEIVVGSSPIGTDVSVCYGETVPDLTAIGNNIMWYNDSLLTVPEGSGNTFTSGITASGTYVYYITQSDTINFCPGLPDTVTLSINNILAGPVGIDAQYCEGITVQFLTSTGTGLQWYDNDSLIYSGDTLITLAINPGTYTYYVSQLTAGCESERDTVLLTLNANPLPPIAVDTSVCSDGEIPDLYVAGTAINWYAEADTSTWLAAGNSFSSGVSSVGTYTYYVTQTDTLIGCVSEFDSVTLFINANPVLPVGSDEMSCSSQPVPALIGSGSMLTWYTDSTLLNPVFYGDTLETGLTIAGEYTYYLTQVINGCESSALPVSLTILDAPDAPIATDELVCYGNPVPDLVANGIDVDWYTDSSLTNWVFNGNTFSTAQTEIGTYTYYIVQTDVATGCSSIYSSVILDIGSDSLIAPLGIDGFACSGDTSATVSATGLVVNWYTDSTMLNFLATGTVYETGLTDVGTYTFYATQVIGCGESGPVAVNLTIADKPLQPVAVSDSICENEMIPGLSASGINLTWYADSLLLNMLDTGTIYTPAISLPGTYTYYVTQFDGCQSDVASVSLSISALSAPPATSDANFCMGVAPYADVTGTNVAWYSDSLLSNLLDTGIVYYPVATDAGTYTYYVTQNNNGCESYPNTSLLTIYPSTASPVGSDTAVCYGNPAPDLTATGTAIFWYSDSLLNNLLYSGITYATGQTAIGVYPYYVTNLDTLNGCSSEPTVVSLIINDLAVTPEGSDLSVCYGQTTPSFSVTGIDIFWYSDSAMTTGIGSGNVFQSLESDPGDYSYYVNENNACGSGPPAILVLTIYDLPSTPAGANDTICWGEVLEPLVVSGNNIRWYAEPFLNTLLAVGNSYTPDVQEIGQYYFYVTQQEIATGCTSEIGVVGLKVNPTPLVTINYEDVTINEGDAVTLIAYNAYTYVWTPDSALSSATGEQVIAAPDTTTIYQVVGTGHYGCTGTAVCTVTVTPFNGIEEVTDLTNFNMFPNPTSGEFTLEFTTPDNELVKITLTNIYGQMVMQKDIIPLNHRCSTTLNIGQFADGIYTVQVITGQSNITRRLIMEHQVKH